MRLKKLSQDFNKYKNYEDKQKLVLDSIISRVNRISDFFDVVVKLEKFIIEEVKDEYSELIDVRNNKVKIETEEDAASYIKNHFLPAVDKLNNKMELSIQSWNHVEREYTTGKK